MTRTFRLAAGMTLAALLCSPFPAFSQSAPNLGTSQSFAVLGGSGVTVAGAAVTTITGDVGSSPTPSITGFPPGQVASGFTLYTTNATEVQNAQSVNTTAYNALQSQGCTNTIAAGTLGGLTLGPGVHCVTGSVMDLTGTLTLSGSGIYVFKASSSLVTASSSNVAVTNGANSCNVYWQVTSSATLGSSSTFRGNIFALASIGLGTTANVTGRTWARNGAVTMDGGNTVGGCSTAVPVGATAPTLAKGFSPFSVAAGAVSTLTITFSNPNTSVATLSASFVDTMPTGVVIAATPNVSTTCSGSGAPTATAGGSTVTLPGTRSIPAGSSSVPGTCTLTVDVTAAAGGSYVNTLEIGSLQTSNGNNTAVAASTLTVVAGTTPTVAKGFSPLSVGTNTASTLTIILSNPTAGNATLTAAFRDTLPTGLVIAATPNAATTCGPGAPSATAGGSRVTLSSGHTILANSSCEIAVNVSAATSGNYVNTIAAGALQTSIGNNASSAVATLTVLPPVPTLSQWALIMLAVLLSLAGVAAIRRRRARGPL